MRGKRIVSTRLRSNVTVREENATAALEVMSRFALDPKWLIYLPPTMAPGDSAQAGGLLEHPAQVFDFFRASGVRRVVCEEKHMGSRAVVVACRDAEAAVRRFGIESESAGAVYTRTGRRFFNDEDRERIFLDRVRAAAEDRGFWDRFETDWICLDCELMPWSAKAKALLRQQYGPVATASRIGLRAAMESEPVDPRLWAPCAAHRETRARSSTVLHYPHPEMDTPVRRPSSVSSSRNASTRSVFVASDPWTRLGLDLPAPSARFFRLPLPFRPERFGSRSLFVNLFDVLS